MRLTRRVIIGAALAVVAVSVILYFGRRVYYPSLGRAHSYPTVYLTFRNALGEYHQEATDYPRTAAEAVEATQAWMAARGIKVYLKDDGVIRIEDKHTRVDIRGYEYNGPDEQPDLNWKER